MASTIQSFCSLFTNSMAVFLDTHHHHQSRSTMTLSALYAIGETLLLFLVDIWFLPENNMKCLPSLYQLCWILCASGRRFNSGIEFASFVTSSHVLLHRSWIVTSSYHEDTCSKKEEGEGLSWMVHKRPDSDLTIIAFEATLDYSDFQADLVPSYAPTEEKILHFDLLCDEINPIFSVNNTTISLFHKNHCRLDQLKSMVHHFLSLCHHSMHPIGLYVYILKTLALISLLLFFTQEKYNIYFIFASISFSPDFLSIPPHFSLHYLSHLSLSLSTLSFFFFFSFSLLSISYQCTPK